jgi:glycosyltransferase involved in cell wall biosynthesis
VYKSKKKLFSFAKEVFFVSYSAFLNTSAQKNLVLYSLVSRILCNFATKMGKTIIGFDAKRIVRNATGLGNYGRTLVNDLATVVPGDWQLRLYAPDAGRDELRNQITAAVQPPTPTTHHPSPITQFVYPQGRPLKLQRSLWRIGPIVKDLQRDGVQLYHGLTGELPRGVRQAGIRSVVTIHDLIFLRHPEYYHWADVKIYAWKFRTACREADRIIAISERTKQDVVELGGVDPERVDVIYQSCSPRFQAAADVTPQQLADVRQRYGLPERFMLSVGSIEERKNMMLAVRSLPFLPDDIHLVAVGKPTKYSADVLRWAERERLAPRVHLLYGVPDEDLQTLYRMAEVFVYPSRYEGFGIPVIEAIHSGLPVVAATGSCLEEAGGPDSLYVSPDDPEALAAAVVRQLKGAAGREQRISLSRDYVRRFEGNDVAQQVYEVYRRLLD